MNELKNWLISKLPVLVPYQISEVISGTQQLTFKFETLNGIDDPLCLKVRSKKKKDASVDEIIKYSISDEVLELQFVKRLQNTPFFVSSLANDNYTLYIIDFYEWAPVTTLYRVFYFQYISNYKKLEVRLPSIHKKLGQNIFSIQDWYFTYMRSGSEKVDNSTLKLPFSEDETRSQIFIFSFSEKQPSSEDLSIKSLLARINKLETEVRKYHILQDLKIQDRKKQQILDELWSRQKGLNPDRNLNKSQSDEEFSNSDVFLWTVELCRYMEWSDLLDTKSKKKFQNFIKGHQNNKKVFYDAYFQDRYTPDEIIDRLQSWWDQYSLPLYRMKFKKELQTNPSLIFIIYSLALQMQLPWSNELYRLSNFFYQEPQIAVLAYLFQLMIVRTGEDNTIQIFPGSESGGNIKTLKRGEKEYRHTRFGKIHFTSLREKNVELLKIDKEVILNHNETLDQIAIKPNIMPIELKSLRPNNISIQINKRMYQVPLIWKKAELSIPGCRIRWIFKKDRFQLTIQADKSIPTVKINKEVVNLKKTQKAKYYHIVGRSENTAVLKLLDISGRSYFLNQDISETTAQIIGWIQDRHGLLVDNFNIRINSHQILCRIQESGIFNKSFSISPNLDSIGIVSKKMYKNIPIRKIENRVNIKLLTYFPRESKGTFLVVLNDELKIRKDEIQHLFLEYLGFIPFILYKSEIKKRLNTNHLVLIGEIDTLYKYEELSTFSKSPLLSIGYPDGIKNLFKILSGQV